MKSIYKFILGLTFVSTIGFLSCKDELVSSEVTASIHQDGKCRGSALYKSNATDSCFDYSFSSSLIIDFCVNGNCCPDSSRFTSSYSIINSEIIIRVKDIAPNLCKCTCRYMLHAELKGLRNDYYTVKIIQEFTSNDEQLYLKSVTRK